MKIRDARVIVTSPGRDGGMRKIEADDGVPGGGDASRRDGAMNHR